MTVANCTNCFYFRTFTYSDAPGGPAPARVCARFAPATVSGTARWSIIDNPDQMFCGDGADATTLISYSAGTTGPSWTPYTPTVTPQSNSFTSIAASGRFAITGKTLFFDIEINCTTAGSAAGPVAVTLPAGLSPVKRTVVMGRNVTESRPVDGDIAAGASSIGNISLFDGTFPIRDNETVILTGICEIE